MNSNSQTVYIPRPLVDDSYTGEVYGYYHEKTKIFNVTDWGETAPTSALRIGAIITGDISDITEVGNGAELLTGIRDHHGLKFYSEGNPVSMEVVDLVSDIYSRNTGILETDIMIDRGVVITGCGSVGSLVALELARCGLGNFLLIDNDIISYHNICRHQCGVSDVGKFKVDAVRERILDINPGARVVTYVGIIEDVPKNFFDDFCAAGFVLVGCADNREGDIYGSTIGSLYGMPFVSIGLWERAFAGEIFYCIPNRDMPCYVCPFGDLSAGLSNRTSANRRIYTTEEDVHKVSFEPGISVDISFVTNIAIKVIIDLLNLDNQKFTPRLINHLTQYTLICNTTNPEIGGEMAEIFAYPLQVTTSLHVDFRPSCPPCVYQR